LSKRKFPTTDESCEASRGGDKEIFGMKYLNPRDIEGVPLLREEIPRDTYDENMISGPDTIDEITQSFSKAQCATTKSDIFRGPQSSSGKGCTQ
jgi:hypothetical protein